MSTPSKSGQKWDDASHVGLLLALLDVAKPSKDVILAVVEHMNKHGFEKTYHGVKYISLNSSNICLPYPDEAALIHMTLFFLVPC